MAVISTSSNHRVWEPFQVSTKISSPSSSTTQTSPLSNGPRKHGSALWNGSNSRRSRSQTSTGRRLLNRRPTLSLRPRRTKTVPGDPHLMLRLSAQFFRLTPSSQLVTLLHETIRMSLELTGKRLQQADDLSQGHFQGKTRSEQAFETQRIELARGLYLFPDEVMAEKHLQQDYPAFAADRLGHYNDIQGRTSENRDYETAEPGLEWPAALWFWLRNKLGALIATTDELGTAFGDRVAFFDARLRDLLPGDQYRRVTGLGRRLLAAGSDSPSVDEEAAGELFKLVVEIAYPRPPQQLH